MLHLGAMSGWDGCSVLPVLSAKRAMWGRGDVPHVAVSFCSSMLC